MANRPPAVWELARSYAIGNLIPTVTEAVRGGVRLSVPVFGVLDPRFHDLAHCDIERKRERDLQDEYWASVAAGITVDGMAVLRVRQQPHA